jgi:hypothetical protein
MGISLSVWWAKNQGGWERSHVWVVGMQLENKKSKRSRLRLGCEVKA